MRIPVLTYHAVRPVNRQARERGTVPLALFREQVDWLRRRGFCAIGLDEAADLLEGRGTRVRRPVVLTFDDGYRCVVEHALPVLQAAGFTATLFVVTGAVGETTDWYAHEGRAPLEHATWDDLERAHERGFTIGSHGVHHVSLSGADPEVLRGELRASSEAIAKRLGRCDHFAYPFGGFGPETIAATERAGYRTASTTRPGLNRPGQALHALRRQGVSRTTHRARLRRRVGLWW